MSSPEQPYRKITSETSQDATITLHDACESGDAQKVMELIGQGADVNAEDENGQTPLDKAYDEKHENLVIALIQNGAEFRNYDEFLHESIADGFLDLSTFIIENGGNINGVDSNGERPLHVAVSKGYLELSSLIVEKSPGINYGNITGETPLHKASFYGNTDIAEMLIEHGANISATDIYSQTPLQHAIANGHDKLAALLIDKINGANGTKSTIESPLHLAAIHGRTELVKTLIENGASVNATDFKGASALYYAATRGHAELVKLLIDLGVSVNATNTQGETALHRAASYNRFEVVQALIEHGGNVNVTDKYLKTPLFNAVTEKYGDVTRLLVQHGADVNMAAIVDVMGGDTPLHRAAYNGDLTIATLLITNKAIVDSVNGKGNTPLHLASGTGYENMARYLVKNGANVNASNNEGKTPLHIVSTRNVVFMVDYLIAFGADVNATDLTGKTALHLAIHADKIKIVYRLIHRGADVNATDLDLTTPLHLVAFRSWLDIAKILVEKGANLHARDKQGLTPWQRASVKGNRQMMQLLIEKDNKTAKLYVKKRTVLGNFARDVYEALVEYASLSGPQLTYPSWKNFETSTSLRRIIHLHESQLQIKIVNPTQLKMIHLGNYAWINEQILKTSVKELETKLSRNFDLTQNVDVAVDIVPERGKDVRDTSSQTGGHRPDGWTSLHEVAFNGDLDGLKECTCRNAGGSDEDQEVSEELLENDIDVMDSNRNTPLHVASKAGHLQIVEYLINKGANVHLTNVDNQTPLSLACTNRHLNVKILLLNHGASLYVPESNTPFAQNKETEFDSQLQLVKLVRTDIEKLREQLSCIVNTERNLELQLEGVERAYEELQSSLLSLSASNIPSLYSEDGASNVTNTNGGTTEMSQDSGLGSRENRQRYKTSILLLVAPILLVTALLYPRLKN